MCSKCVFLEASLVNPEIKRGDKLSPLDIVCVALLTLGTYNPNSIRGGGGKNDKKNISTNI